jgi:hypothetical protein
MRFSAFFSRVLVACPIYRLPLFSLNCSVKSIDFDEEMDRHFYELAIADAEAAKASLSEVKSPAASASASGGSAGGSDKAITTSDMDVMEAYHKRASAVLSPLHPVVITSAFKLALFWTRKRRYVEAERLVLDALLRCEVQ